MIVTLNEVRGNSSTWRTHGTRFHMACRFAKLHGLPIIKWRLPTNGARVTAMTQEEIEQLYIQEQNLWGIFVKGAPGYLTSNINPSKGLMANGTAIVYETMSFNNEESDFENVQRALLQISLAEPGDIENGQ